MRIEEFDEQMKKLAACELLPEEWLSWWDRHEQVIAGLVHPDVLKKGEYLRIKPHSHQFRWVPVLGSQGGAIGYLQARNIECAESDLYRKNYERELDDYCKEEDRIAKEKIKTLKSDFPALFAKYPKFSQSLKHNYDTADVIADGADEAALKDAETRLGFPLPADVREFFATVSKLQIEGIHIDIEGLHTLDLSGKSYCVLGDYWREADGDLLLIKTADRETPANIYYYAHEQNKVKLLCKGMHDLMEKKFAWYNRHMGS